MFIFYIPNHIQYLNLTTLLTINYIISLRQKSF